ncbi:DNA internalization-related competence protein ComEC/Rec2 [Thiomicrorhabdus sp. Kp2]|uniref:DNA internalization-related competence protein ComEC/Rec2 n=1 Tax=Thiomicrorhabdus sp. Kp2 TaxID=1123518 RepID=UPI0012FEE1A8|nr:DNA internalization-related competence protein ComEC/Rec2 [Thiomicrorhabdus sp. Kp2]
MFIQFVIGFIVTVILCYQLTEFPPLWSGGLLLVLLIWAVWFITFYRLRHFYFKKRRRLLRQSLSIISWQNRIFHLVFSAIIGMNVVFWQAFFAPSISNVFLEHKNLIEVEVLSIPKVVKSEHFSKIVFEASLSKVTTLGDVSLLKNSQAWLLNKPKIKLTWYLDNHEFSQLINQDKQPLVGERWRFYAKLKSNHAAMNLASRDYEKWLFQNHVVAKSTVSGLYLKHQNQQKIEYTAIKLQSQSFINWRVWRAEIVDYLDGIFKDSPFKGIYLGMTVGEKSAVNEQQWALFQQTGTIHLMAISGLHMSIVAVMGFWLFKYVWRLGLYRYQLINLQTFSALGGLFFATVYLLLSGAAIPTQRAWIMVATALMFILIRRQFRPWSALAMAAFIVVVWDSRAVLSSGFWLSFMAVSLIFLALKIYQNKSKWHQFLGIQLMLTAGLAPFILWSFYQVPVYGLFANLIAVPFVSLIGLPGLVVVIFSSLFSLELANYLLEKQDWFWQQIWSYLHFLVQLPKLDLNSTNHSFIWLIAVSSVLFVLITSFKFLQKRFAVSTNYFSTALVLYFMILLFFPYSNNRPMNQTENQLAWLTVLDVGQGQAVVIETAHHLVVYDTGAKWGQTTDAAKVAVIPYLTAQGWQAIDLLIVSHSDIDHAGGTQSILDAISVNHALSGQAQQVNLMLNNSILGEQSKPFKSCLSGQQWVFDGIRFEILSPFENAEQKGLKTDNDLSCVLKVSNQNQSVLIMGDLSKKGEKILLNHYQNQAGKLQADLLIAGHHGSKTSTSQAWLDAVKPTKLVFSSGYLNRFHFPAKDVVNRIQNVAENNPISWWNTACSGGISFEINHSNIELRYEARKSLRKWYHHSCLQSQQGIYFQ